MTEGSRCSCFRLSTPGQGTVPIAWLSGQRSITISTRAGEVIHGEPLGVGVLRTSAAPIPELDLVVAGRDRQVALSDVQSVHGGISTTLSEVHAALDQALAVEGAAGGYTAEFILPADEHHVVEVLIRAERTSCFPRHDS